MQTRARAIPVISATQTDRIGAARSDVEDLRDSLIRTRRGRAVSMAASALAAIPTVWLTATSHPYQSGTSNVEFLLSLGTSVGAAYLAARSNQTVESLEVELRSARRRFRSLQGASQG